MLKRNKNKSYSMRKRDENARDKVLYYASFLSLLNR